MKTKLLTVVIMLCASFWIGACNMNDVDEGISLECGGENSVDDLSWLNQKLEDIKDHPESGIILYRYNAREIVEVQSSLMSSTNNSQYYCDGTKVNLENPEVYQDFLKNRVELKILYGIDLWKL
ncbi:hypothetical protein MMU07_03580 [Aquiflexum sp. LQ15W]|uniref:hypothetical protein n=1 Tax=Cognataquiflexum nitidum TaxID=2922272 RepID=UPI001F143CE0|nr:hypothetical protein [Cognataquiflexum nitidum]MCH6198647.1 hypothetical protein [Cognataquiflexum nitidum]